MWVLHIFLLLDIFLGSFSQFLLPNEIHCSQACWQCPTTTSRPICAVSPFLMEYSCLCMVHHALCMGLVRNLIFYPGSCHPDPKYHLENHAVGLYTFQRNRVKTLREPFLFENAREPSVKILKLEDKSTRQHSIISSEVEVPEEATQNHLRPHKEPTKEKERENIEVNKKENEAKCRLFFRRDREFQRAFINKHFECPNADASKTQKLT